MWGSGPQIDKHLLQSPFTGQFFLDDDILLCLLWVLSYYGSDCLPDWAVVNVAELSEVAQCILHLLVGTVQLQDRLKKGRGFNFPSM